MQIILGPVMRLKMWLNGAVKLVSTSNGSHSDRDGKEDINGIKTSLGFENLRLFLVCISVCVSVHILCVCVCVWFVERWLFVGGEDRNSKEVQDIWQKLRIYINIKQGQIESNAYSGCNSKCIFGVQVQVHIRGVSPSAHSGCKSK